MFGPPMPVEPAIGEGKSEEVRMLDLALLDIALLDIVLAVASLQPPVLRSSHPLIALTWSFAHMSM